MRPGALRPATAKAAAASRQKLAARLSPGETTAASAWPSWPASMTPSRCRAPPPTSSPRPARTAAAAVHIICDFIQVLEYTWKAAWSFFEPADPDAETWVAEQAAKILGGKAAIVTAGIRRRATTYGYSAREREGADACADYLTGKRPYLDCATALANGWPIATGVIEGACRYLVNDRMDLTGARWAWMEPKPSSSSAPTSATATSTNTGHSTCDNNTSASTRAATATASYSPQDQLTPKEPHPLPLPLGNITTVRDGCPSPACGSEPNTSATELPRDQWEVLISERG